MPKVPESHLEARRQQILTAAIGCFARKGIQGTSMQDIFDASGLSPGAVYRYFRSKQEIISATCEVGARQEAEGFAAQLQSMDPGLALDEFARQSFGRIGDPAALPGMRASVAFLQEALHNEEVREHYRLMVDALVGAMAQAVAAMQQRGQAPADVDPHHAGRVLYAMYEGCMNQKLLFPELDVGRFVEAMMGLLAFAKPQSADE